MSSENLSLFIILTVFLNSLFNKVVIALNIRNMNGDIPSELKDVFDENEYAKSQLYEKTKFYFQLIKSSIITLILITILLFDGFGYLDTLSRNVSTNQYGISILFLSFIICIYTIFILPFSWYEIFRIEQKFGFNRTSKKIFFIDKIKECLLNIVIMSIFISIITFLYEIMKDDFWIYAWISICSVIFLGTLFHSILFVPLFNKLNPLPEGELKNKLIEFAERNQFSLQNISVINNSIRSTKLNAYISGFGSQKRIVLYDTLISSLNPDEIVAIFNHELGHYKHKHIILQLLLLFCSVGITLFALSFFLGNPILHEAMGVYEKAIHVDILSFILLFTPISIILNILINIVSRRSELEADNFAAKNHNSGHLIAALKKLTKGNYNNINPHGLYVYIYHSHPTLLNRIQRLSR